ncbi:ATP-binding protein, partial [Micromonospora tulbaghiae]
RRPADGLPRRIRRRGATARPRAAVADTPAHRTPEEARRAMSALQAGTARGRRDGSRAAGTGPATPATEPRDTGTPSTTAGPAVEPAPPAPDQRTATERDA